MNVHSALRVCALTICCVTWLACASDDPAEGDASSRDVTDDSRGGGDASDRDTVDPDIGVLPGTDAATDTSVEPDGGGDAGDSGASTDTATGDTADDDSTTDSGDTDTDDDAPDADDDGDTASDADDDTADDDADDDSGDLPCIAPSIGDLLITEVLPSPAMEAAGDANCDGTRNAVDDEFIEVVNLTDRCLSLGGLRVVTATGGTRVTLAGSVELSVGGTLLLFGGGAPTFDGTSPAEGDHCVSLASCAVVIQTALPDSLALAPSDTVRLEFGESVLDTVTWGGDGVELVSGQSLTRATFELAAEFEPHGVGDQGDMSPGLHRDPRVCFDTLTPLD